MPLQTSMGAHKLDVRYGDRFSLPYYNGIILSTIISSSTASLAIVAGRVFSLTSAGYLVPGLLAGAAAGATGGQQPFFGLTGLDTNNYPDTQRDAGMPSYGNVPVSGTDMAIRFNNFNGIPTTGNYAGPFATIRYNAAAELSTTEFDTALTYVPGAPLTCITIPSVATVASTAGRIRTLALATDVIIGYVGPAGAFTGPEGYPTLAFTPAFIPNATNTVPVA